MTQDTYGLANLFYAYLAGAGSIAILYALADLVIKTRKLIVWIVESRAKLKPRQPVKRPTPASKATLIA